MTHNPGAVPMLSPSVTAQLIAKVSTTAAAAPGVVSDDARHRLGLLSEREQEVARALARGLSNAEISGELFLSVATVKTHVGRILTKGDLDNRVQIALLVRDAEA